MLSKTVIEAPLRVLVVDATENVEGFEWEVASRLLAVLGKRGVALVDDEPLKVADVSDIGRRADAVSAATCVVLLGSEHGPPGRGLAVWEWIGSNVAGPKLAVVCQWGAGDWRLTDAVLEAPTRWAPIGIAQESAVSPREGGLFLLKFLTEMDLHSDERMSGRMAWFSWKKADELVKRRGMAVRFGLRA